MTSSLRFAGAAALLVGAAVHAAQLVSIFHAVPWVGPLFGADVVVSTAVAVALLATRGRLAPAAGAAVSAGALAGLAVSSTVGLFGWQEATLRPAVVIAIAAELAAVAALAPLALPAPPSRAGLVWRAVAGTGLVAIAALHIAAAGDEWGDTRGVFWLFMTLAGVCLAVAARLAIGLDRWARPVVLALALVPIAGYVVSRTTGLPDATDDVGDWGNTLGLAALAVEAALTWWCTTSAPGTTVIRTGVRAPRPASARRSARSAPDRASG
ncbi:MAG TPA: hypothetical protein VFX51_06155 [Solirubrobacteraceae bacterium]|nr:hypothetical protein [Solirubrobacteraceae bacterium]